MTNPDGIQRTPDGRFDFGATHPEPLRGIRRRPQLPDADAAPVEAAATGGDLANELDARRAAKTAQTKTTIRVRGKGREGVLSVIPSMLGYHPKNSLVMATFTAGGNSLGPVARVDLDAVQGARGAESGRQLAELAANNNVDRAVIVIYTDEPDRMNDVDPLMETLTAKNLELTDVFATPNAPSAIDENLAAEQALLGSRVLPDREAVVRSIAYGGLTPTPETSQMLNRMDTVAGRDALLTDAISDTRTWMPKLILAAQSTPDTDPRCADLVAVLAMVSYRQGDGALATVALDRAEAINPHHGLTRLLNQFIREGMPPAALDGIVANQ